MSLKEPKPELHEELARGTRTKRSSGASRGGTDSDRVESRSKSHKDKDSHRPRSKTLSSPEEHQSAEVKSPRRTKKKEGSKKADLDDPAESKRSTRPRSNSGTVSPNLPEQIEVSNGRDMITPLLPLSTLPSPPVFYIAPSIPPSPPARKNYPASVVKPSPSMSNVAKPTSALKLTHLTFSASSSGTNFSVQDTTALQLVDSSPALASNPPISSPAWTEQMEQDLVQMEIRIRQKRSEEETLDIIIEKKRQEARALESEIEMRKAELERLRIAAIGQLAENNDLAPPTLATPGVRPLGPTTSAVWASLGPVVKTSNSDPMEKISTSRVKHSTTGLKNSGSASAPSSARPISSSSNPKTSASVSTSSISSTASSNHIKSSGTKKIKKSGSTSTSQTLRSAPTSSVVASPSPPASKRASSIITPSAHKLISDSPKTGNPDKVRSSRSSATIGTGKVGAPLKAVGSKTVSRTSTSVSGSSAPTKTRSKKSTSPSTPTPTTIAVDDDDVPPPRLPQL